MRYWMRFAGCFPCMLLHSSRRDFQITAPSCCFSAIRGLGAEQCSIVQGRQGKRRAALFQSSSPSHLSSLTHRRRNHHADSAVAHPLVSAFMTTGMLAVASTQATISSVNLPPFSITAKRHPSPHREPVHREPMRGPASCSSLRLRRQLRARSRHEASLNLTLKQQHADLGPSAATVWTARAGRLKFHHWGVAG